MFSSFSSLDILNINYSTDSEDFLEVAKETNVCKTFQEAIDISKYNQDNAVADYVQPVLFGCTNYISRPSHYKQRQNDSGQKFIKSKFSIKTYEECDFCGKYYSRDQYPLQNSMCFQCGIKKHVQTICQQMKYCKFNAGVKKFK